ncbi:Fe-S cluster assembly protein SufD [Sediminivirga luteola]|uniref:Fe-S cluster assembly protein SufD n=1 Tax=Sediminivirga luteola TaxID=1774748 RepID=A0A8J2XJU0_9MICO|nr:Fe-S cluster assembly protein SufD [Sediminivirga luteola]GGA22532.1 Fe-S cluster assembly protein SufD [Sediminivirga luteola]
MTAAANESVQAGQPAQHGAVPHSHGAGAQVPALSRDDRIRSFDPADYPQVTGTQEEWRYTPLKQIGDLLVDEAGTGTLGAEEALPAGVTSRAIGLEEARALGIPAPEDRPAAIAAARAPQVLHYDIAQDAQLSEPVFIGFTGTDAGQVAHSHVAITAGANSTATVVIEHKGEAKLSQLLSTVIGAGAKLTVISLQLWDDEAVHLAQHDGKVGRDAEYKHIAISLGGKIVRVASNVVYDGPGGDARLLGLYFADAGQYLEHRTFIDHNAPNANSDVLYKGALQGEGAHTVWVGDVLIRNEALGINTYELNRNLVLTDGARADSVPNLEIETGEIEGAGHASSTGRFDEEHLFYLMSRGIPEIVARRLVVRGFFNEVIQQIKVPEVEARLMDAIEEELQRSML